MIEQISDISEFSEYKVKDIYSVRIFSLLYAYGCKYPFARFYRQTVENVTTAVLAVLDRDVTVSFIENLADVQELSGFISVIGYSSVLCSDTLHINSEYSTGTVMSTDKKIEIPCDYNVIDEYPYLFDLYNFIDYGENSFEAWYVDISHRIRHNAAKAVSLNFNGEIVSSAILSSIYNDDAVLTAVQTKPEFRKQGCASALVSSICCDIKGTVYLMREENNNESFYKRLGFENIGKWRIYK